MAVMGNLYNTFINLDCSLTEINPLVITQKGKVVAIDAKMDIDDNALYRHKDLIGLDDYREKDPLEVKAEKYNLNYIRLDGNVGAMVNGAGLAMATMDVIKMAGAEPANFLDVGGGADEEMIENGFKIILDDEKVKAIFDENPSAEITEDRGICSVCGGEADAGDYCFGCRNLVCPKCVEEEPHLSGCLDHPLNGELS